MALLEREKNHGQLWGHVIVTTRDFKGDLQLVAPGVVNVARDTDRGGTAAGLDVLSKELVGRRPVEEVDEVDAEERRVGVNGRPGQVVGLALGEGSVGSRVGELNGGNQGSREGDERQQTDHLD